LDEEQHRQAADEVEKVRNSRVNMLTGDTTRDFCHL